MKVAVRSEQEIDIESLAGALANAEPSEFAAFWFQFSDKASDDNLEKFAEAMAHPMGGRRKEPLRRLCSLMEYHEIKRGRK